MKVVKFFLSVLDKRTKKHQTEEMKETPKMDITDLWKSLDEEGKEALKKEMSQTARVRTLGENPETN